MSRALSQLAIALIFASFSLPAAADEVSSLRGKLRSSTDSDYRMNLVRDLADCAETVEGSASKVAYGLGTVLLDKDVTVAAEAARLFRRDALRPYAADHLAKALVKHALKHKSLVKSQEKNYATLDRLMDQQELATIDDLQDLLTTLNQFLEAALVVSEKTYRSTALIEAISDSLVLFPEDDSVTSLKKAFRKITGYSPVSAVPVMEALVELGARSGVKTVVKKLGDYSYKQDQRERRDFFELDLDIDWVDWGERFHEALSELALSIDPDLEIPKHGKKTPEFWSEWWKENEENLPTSPKLWKKAGEADDEEDDDEDEDDE